MKSRLALACALALGAGGAFAQAAKTPVTAESFIQIYGHVDVSVDYMTKGISEGETSLFNPANTATGKLGYQADVSSNLSYFGVRGARELGESGLRAVFQIETQVDVAATPGSTTDSSVKGAFASRNSYLGLAGNWGAVKAGKTDAPYKLSTGRMDPFSATIGDYNSIIGNTGGDNRAEFDTRLSHAVWYESPNMSGFRVDALWAPGQNRAQDNSIVASGEPNCTGGNPEPCTDGSFGDAYSIAGTYDAGPMYLVAAYEKHKDVNRLGDEAGGGGPAPLGAVGVRNERAWKVGIQYTLPTKTTLNAIYEDLARDAPDNNFNERQHKAFWLAATQRVGERDDVNLGWAHAGKTPGDPQIGPVDNEANMYAVGYKHHFDRQTNWYAVFARQDNHKGAHYDLGASGHGITTDCHDANGNCFPGAKPQGVSVGMQYNF
ncbi:MAG TPA: porin [Burkholderiales bacterium]|jgi:predicted porin|nr:porin [Burkholderiales bacterium]